MTIDIVVSHRGERDFASAHRWYSRQSPNVATKFAIAFDRTLAKISFMPKRFAKFDHRHRYAKLQKFSYIVLFRIHSDFVLVVGVGHTSRSDRYWKSRTKS